MTFYRLHLILELLLGSLHLVVSLPEVEVGGVLLDSQLITGLLDGVEDGLPQPLGLCHGLLGQHLVVLTVGVPGLGLNTPVKNI